MRKLLVTALILVAASTAFAATTTNYGLAKPDENSSGWASSVNANFDTIDAKLLLIPADKHWRASGEVSISGAFRAYSTGYFEGAVSAQSFSASTSVSAATVVASTSVSEGGTLLANKYLGLTAKAADANLLDNLDSTAFLRLGTSGTVSADQTFAANILASGSRDIGTAPAPFNNGYFTTLYQGGVSLASAYATAGHNHDATNLRLDGTNTMSGNFLMTKNLPQVGLNRTSGQVGQYATLDFQAAGVSQASVRYDFTGGALKVGFYDSASVAKAYYDITNGKFVTAGVLETVQGTLNMGADASLYRSGANQLRTDDALVVNHASGLTVLVGGGTFAGSVGCVGLASTGAVSGTSLATTSNGNITAHGSGNISTTTGTVSGANVSATVNVSGSTLTSTVATGTKPLTVTSTTMVDNLNANFVGGQNLAGLDGRYVDIGGDTLTGTLTSRAVVPSAHNSYDIGTSINAAFKDGYFAGNLYEGGTALSAKYVDVSGDTLTGSLNTRALYPSAHASYDVGSSAALAYRDGFFSRKLYSAGIEVKEATSNNQVTVLYDTTNKVGLRVNSSGDFYITPDVALRSVFIAGHVVPTYDASYNLGGPSNRYASGYFQTVVASDSITEGGTALASKYGTSSGSVTWNATILGDGTPYASVKKDISSGVVTAVLHYGLNDVNVITPLATLASGFRPATPILVECVYTGAVDGSGAAAGVMFVKINTDGTVVLSSPTSFANPYHLWINIAFPTT